MLIIYPETPLSKFIALCLALSSPWSLHAGEFRAPRLTVIVIRLKCYGLRLECEVGLPAGTRFCPVPELADPADPPNAAESAHNPPGRCEGQLEDKILNFVPVVGQWLSRTAPGLCRSWTVSLVLRGGT